MRARSWWWIAALIAVAGCSQAPEPVPVVGAPTDVRGLTGEWGGEYEGETTGRSGSIVFRLTANADTARGDVVMIPRERRPPADGAPPSVGLPMPASPEVLSIAFVRAAEAGNVSGELKPYRDPDCDCQVQTTFTGRLQGNVIEGTYRTVRADGSGTPTSGTWKVTRKSE